MPIKKLIESETRGRFSTGNEDLLSEVFNSVKNSESKFASKTERKFKDFIGDSKTCPV